MNKNEKIEFRIINAVSIVATFSILWFSENIEQKPKKIMALLAGVMGVEYLKDKAEQFVLKKHAADSPAKTQANQI